MRVREGHSSLRDEISDGATEGRQTQIFFSRDDGTASTVTLSRRVNQPVHLQSPPRALYGRNGAYDHPVCKKLERDEFFLSKTVETRSILAHFLPSQRCESRS